MQSGWPGSAEILESFIKLVNKGKNSQKRPPVTTSIKCITGTTELFDSWA